jgi:alpha-galactosidase
MPKKTIVLLWIWIMVRVPAAAGPTDVQAPANAPGEITVDGGRIRWTYDGGVVFEAAALGNPDGFTVNRVIQDIGGRVHQLLVLTAHRGQDAIDIRGTIRAGAESFPCEAEPRDHGLRIVRHVSGLSRSLLNRGIYDRTRDWLLSVDHNPLVEIVPLGEDSSGRSYAVAIRGAEIILRFRPRFYQKHRGLAYFEPWTYRIWPQPVMGWCSWFAYHADITEEDVKQTADVMAEVLMPYGYQVLQIDDGYQRGEGMPELWLRSNEKFPSGLPALAEYIAGRGLTPGIWTNVAFKQRDYARSRRDLFVLDESGEPSRGNWIDMSIDGSNPRALDTLVRPVYRGLREMGWRYFKVDALRHLRYEGYNSRPEYFERKGVERVEAFRDLVGAIREEIGRRHFILGCWGLRPELIGLIDGCRIGTDGFSFAGLSQYNSFNNVVWLNDPDHIELSPEEAYRSTMVTSLTGSLFLLTDRPEVYRTPMAEPAKRAAPVLSTRPGQVYDVDPERSRYLHRAEVEVTGSGPRVFDAGRDPHVHLFLLEIERRFENWVLMGRTGGSFPVVPFADLGLDPEREYFVYEFWTRRLLGSFTGGFDPGGIDPRFHCQLFCIRARLDRPQIIATDRHITCGGHELDDVIWQDDALSGRSRLIQGDPYVLSVAEPPGYRFDGATCDGRAEVVRAETGGGLRRILIIPKKTSVVSWAIKYESRKAEHADAGDGNTGQRPRPKGKDRIRGKGENAA